MLTNEEKLKDLRNLLVLNPDDPIDDYLTPADMIDFIDELLALRSIRDAGDEEVDTEGLKECLEQRKTLYTIARAFAKSTETRNAAKDVVDLVVVCEKLRDIAIARCQQLREASEEVDRLKKKQWHKDHQIDSLTSERDKLFKVYTETCMRHGVTIEFRDQEIRELRDLLTSARAIAERKGVDTAWERFAQRLADAGIGSVTAKVFKVLPSDLEVNNGE